MLCEKAKAVALAILRDADAPYWDKAEAESYLRNELVRPLVWSPKKVYVWSMTERDFKVWLKTAVEA